MIELIKGGGWLIWPILACSIVALGIICERFWTLRTGTIIPPKLVPQIWQMFKQGKLDSSGIRTLRSGSALGTVLAAGLVNRKYGRVIMKESLEEAGRQVVHEMERFLNTLGTIASITPLLGLLGTVVGMIKVFSVITSQGVGDPSVLAGGISEALITTAAGLAVAIPSLMFHRYFHGKVIYLVLRMEEEAIRLIDIIHGEREESIEQGKSGQSE